MLLAGALANHRGALRADFQRFYGLPLDGLGRAFSVEQAADLAAALPPEARLWASVDPARAWTDSEYLLASIEYRLRVIDWRLAGDKSAPAPTPWQTPADRARLLERVEATDCAAIAEAFGIDIDGGEGWRS